MKGIGRTWFESWFDSPYYHLLYRDRDEKEAEYFLNLLLDRIHLPTGSRVMDLACGKGRYSVQLHRHGLKVTGVDLSSANIEACKAYETENLEFFQHDMRHLFRVNYFDAVFNLFTSFGYFEREHENELAIQNASKSLSHGGYFIMDFLNMDFALKQLPVNEEKEIEGILFRIRKERDDLFLRKKISFSHNGVDHQYEEKIRILFPDDLHLFFARSGLSIVQVYGDYSLHPFHADSSPRLIFITRKI